MEQTVEAPKVAEPKLTRAQRRQLERDQKVIMIHSKAEKKFHHISRGAHEQMWMGFWEEKRKAEQMNNLFPTTNKHENIGPKEAIPSAKDNQGGAP